MEQKLEKLKQLQEALEQQIKQMNAEKTEAEEKVSQLSDNILRTTGRVFELKEVIEFLEAPEEEKNGDESPPNTSIE